RLESGGLYGGLVAAWGTLLLAVFIFILLQIVYKKHVYLRLFSRLTADILLKNHRSAATAKSM
ncbi:MAG: hypothetical protein K2P35_06960, partial [Lachnospiraceae bacterium]|nr:hypothetical protein [Lachnospiraceae bacterium]